MIGESRTPIRRDQFGRTINRDHSSFLLFGLPLLTILLGSLAPMLPVIAAGPILPPIGYMIFIAWRLVRPGLLPVWIGPILGAFDDLFSGQPFGSAILLWSLSMIVLDAIEARFPWRGFWQDWLTAAGLLAAYLALGALIAAGGPDFSRVPLVFPQLLLSVFAYPLIARMVARFDQVRLMRIKVLR